MRVFYRGPRALITAEQITVRSMASHSFALADLSDVYLVRQQGARGSGASRTMGVSALVGALIVGPVVGPVSVQLTSLLLLAMVLSAFLCLRVGPPAHHELVARYRGEPVVVFASDDQREFGQVCRGLQRAMEQQR
jgi:hypothetical protein